MTAPPPSTHSNDDGNSNENNKNSDYFIRPQVDDFSNRFMNFRIQLQKILCLLVLAIERQ